MFGVGAYIREVLPAAGAFVVVGCGHDGGGFGAAGDLEVAEDEEFVEGGGIADDGKILTFGRMRQTVASWLDAASTVQPQDAKREFLELMPKAQMEDLLRGICHLAFLSRLLQQFLDFGLHHLVVLATLGVFSAWVNMLNPPCLVDEEADTGEVTISGIQPPFV